jgi:hypothetical protein
MLRRVIALGLALSAQPPLGIQGAWAAQTADLVRGLSRCVNIESPTDRLACFDAEAARRGIGVPASNTASSGAWEVTETVSPFDDSGTVIAQTIGQRDLSGWLKVRTPHLVVRCKEGETDVYVTTGMTEAGDFSDIRLRFDREGAQSQRWSHSTDGEAVFYHRGEAKEFAAQLALKGALLFEITPFNSSPTHTSFSLAGSVDAIRRVAKTCDWADMLDRRLKGIPDSEALVQDLRGDDIAELQGDLASLGHYGGEIDGRNGPETLHALKEFQADQGLPPTGSLDLVTRGRLLLLATRPASQTSTENRPARLTGLGNRLTVSEVDAIRHQIEQCWSAPAGARNIDVRMRISLKPDGSLLRPPEILDQDRMEDLSFLATAESARLAVQKCTPLKNLPPTKYERWQEITLTLNPRQLLGN